MLCVYHSADLDGFCSAAIVKHKFPECELYGINYSEEIPWDLFKKHYKILMVDFSLPQNDMVRFVTEFDVVWLDHHKSAIDDMSGHHVFGNQEVGRGTCELTWEYLFPHKKTPLAVKLLSQYDVWNHTDEETLPFQYGIRILDTHPSNQKLWQSLFKKYNSGLVQDIIDNGKIVLNYVDNQNKIYSKFCFATTFEGYKVIAVNRILTNSKVFDFVENIDQYDVMITFGWRDKLWCFSVYSNKKDIDVSKIAKKYGGGGHANAAGFSSETIPFET